MCKGNTLIVFSIFIAIFLCVLMLIVVLFMSHINSILYNFKLNVYSMAKSGIISINKNKASTGSFSYDTKTFKKELEKSLKENYDLDDDMSNEDKLISQIKIKDYKLYRKGQTDSYTKQKCDDDTLHIVLDVKLRPIILRQLLEKIFTFTIHEDVNLNPLKM